MANPGRTVPIKPVPGYGVFVTEPQSEPTLADVLEVMKVGFAQLSTAIADTRAEMREGFTEVRGEIAASEDRLRGEIQATEADLKSRIGAVQEVLRTVKADIAAHVNDPNAHRPHAA